MRIPSIAESHRRSHTVNDDSLSTTERRQRVQAFYEALKSDDTGILTIPEYVSTDLTPDQTLCLILQDACSTASTFLSEVNDSEDDEEQ